MTIHEFIETYRKAFGEKPSLPIAVWYSPEPVASTPKTGGCIFKHLDNLLAGGAVSLHADNIGCGGGKLYCGYSELPEFVPNYVSLKERYKRTPEMVVEFVETLGIRRAEPNYLNLARIDALESFDDVEGVIFFATPDVLSGLFTWTTFDLNAPDAVSSLFGSGCSNVITMVVNENARGGYRSYLGFFDLSARPYVDKNVLSFSIPMSRFREMLETMPDSCLFDTHAWEKVHQRINE